ncbi:MAG: HAMP domain-containing sensor histidine kinase [Endomicrobiales bacterium]|jgi:signal transduction histidine kinase
MKVGNSLFSTYTLNDKWIVIVLRFLVILVTFFLTLYNAPETISPVALSLTFLVFLASDIVLIFLSSYIFALKLFRNGIFLVDVVLISCIIYLTGGMKSDLYLIYFLIIFMASSGSNLVHAFMVTIVVAGIYVFLLIHMGLSFSLSNPGVLLRIPFIFIVSFVFLYYAQEEKRHVQARAERSARLSLVGEMTAEIIHEINNPLTVIMGYAQILKEEDPAVALKELWPPIVTATERLSEKINGILAFVRSDKETEKEPVNVITIVESALELCKGQLRGNNIELIREFQKDIPSIMGFYHGIEQVFINIITNACHALGETQEKEHRKLIITIAYYGKKVVVIFKDNGIGIKEADRDKIFDPFFSTKPRDKGTGLGLTTGYKIVKEHHGDIYVRDQADPGATFVVELPAVMRP